MLSRQFVREHPDEVRETVERRGMSDEIDLDRILTIDEEWREAKARGDELRHERNEISSQIGDLKREGDEEAAEQAIERSGELKAELETLEERTTELESELESALIALPQILDESVPSGAGEEENVELRREGFDDVRSLPSQVIPHYELGEQLGIIDETRAAKTTGSGFFFLMGDGARLEHALIQFMLDLHREQGYTDVFPPIPINSRSMTGTGQLPKFDEDAYKIENEDLWLCPTAEVPVTNMYADEILLRNDLPLKHQAYTPNFRREAGEHGTETRGIVRVHQFNKVELVNFAQPDSSYERFEQLLDEAEETLRRLELPYRVLEICDGDISEKAAKQVDLEIWAPGDDMPDGPEQGGRWLEVSSVSNFEDYQARRAGLRYRPERHEHAEYLHTLNGSGVALPRVMVAILEYYQNEDGTVTVPDVLQPYLGGQERIEGRESVGESALGSEGQE